MHELMNFEGGENLVSFLPLPRDDSHAGVRSINTSGGSSMRTMRILMPLWTFLEILKNGDVNRFVSNAGGVECRLKD